MTVTLELKPDIEQGLQAQAQALGVSLDDFLQQIVTRQASQSAPANPNGQDSLDLPILHLGAMDAMHRADLYDDAR